MFCLNCLKRKKIKFKIFLKKNWLRILLTSIYIVICLILFTLSMQNSTLFEMTEFEKKNFNIVIKNAFGINLPFMVFGLFVFWMCIVEFFVSITEKLILYIVKKIKTYRKNKKLNKKNNSKD